MFTFWDGSLSPIVHCTTKHALGTVLVTGENISLKKKAQKGHFSFLNLIPHWICMSISRTKWRWNGNWQNDKISWLEFDRKIRAFLSDAKERNVHVAREA